jgi:hypothetical protein
MSQVSAGGVLSRAFEVWTKNFVAFFLISAVVYVPAVVCGVMFTTGSIAVSQAVNGFITWVLVMLLGMVASGAITYGVFEQLRGQRVSVGEALGRGLGRVPSLLGIAFLLLLIFMGLGIVLAIGGGIVGALFGLASPILGGLIFLVIVGVPLVAMYCRFYVAVPAAVVESAGSTDALRRSAFLTDSYRKTVAGIVVLVLGLNWGTSLLWSYLLRNQPYLLLAVNWFFTIALGALSSTASAVTYHDLRVVKEGVGTDELAAVFD